MKLEIKKAGINGEGIGFCKRKPVFVEGCFPGETVECDIVDEGRHCRGTLKKICQKSPDRIRSVCRHDRKCGGCTLIALNYEGQLKIKKQLLQDALYKYASYEDEIDDIVPSGKLFGYRNKCNLPVIEHDGRLVSALYKQGSNHPALIEDCPVHDERIEEIRKQILKVLNRHHCHAYVHKQKSGIRQLVIRGFENQYQAVIITGNDDISELVDDLKQIKGLCSICQGINTRKNPVQLMPEHLKLLYGNGKIETDAGGYRLRLSPQAFFQLNKEQAERIYHDVSDLIEGKKSLIVEAYCGIGAISLYLHDKAERLIGIEVIDRAVKDARENAKINHFNHLTFVCDDASKALRKIAKKEEIDVLIVDPPRSGLDEEMLETLLKTKISQIIYVSCNPSTLGKDLGVLQEKYHIDHIRGYDMFPNTPLVEAVCLLTRSSRKKKHNRGMTSMKQIFESENISYVEVSEFLVKDYLDMVNDYENVNRFIGSKNKSYTEEQERQWVQKKLDEKAVVFSMIDKKSGEFIGNIEMVDIHDSEGELGIAITAKKQESGFGTEAVSAMTDYGLNQLGLKRVCLRAKPYNDRAIHVYEKCGFREYDRTDEDVCMEYVPGLRTF